VSRDERELHGWVSGRLEQHGWGLLPEAEAEQLERHLASCADCRAALEEIAARRSSARVEHVPAAVLARWPKSRRRLGSLERELVERHLADCEECHTALEVVRSARVPGRPAWGLLRSLDVPRPWLAAWAVGATAAFVACAILWRTGAAPAPAPASRVPPAPAPRVAFALEVAGEGLRLADVTRGAAAAEPTAEPGPGEPVALTFDPLDVPDATPVRIEVVDGDDRAIASAVRPERELYPHRRLLLGSAAAPLPDGRYRLRMIAMPSGAAPDTQAYAFSVRRRR